MYYASRTKDTEDFISANEVTAKEQGGPFYCPCIKCDCEFGIRAINSNKRKANFFKLPTSKHSEDCFVPYVKSEDGNITDYETESLEPSDLLEKIKQNSSSRNVAKRDISNKKELNNIKSNEQKPIKTIRQLHAICAANKPCEYINSNIRVCDLYAGKNTSYLYTRYISGIKLVECNYMKRYDKKSNTLYFKYTHKDGELLLKVNIDNETLFKSMNHLLWDFSGPVIIYAEWKNNWCEIVSKKQLIPLKN